MSTPPRADIDIHTLRGPAISVVNASRFAQCALALSEDGDARCPGIPVDLTEVARSAVEQVQHTGPALEALPEVCLHMLPWAHGAPDLLRQVFVNLVANAFRFTRGVPGPMVEIGVSAGAAGPALYVRDNGIGFEASRADALFEPFGIGLSLVRRVVERHGGRVWADAGAEGATFYFTLSGLGETPAAPTPAPAACRTAPAPAA